WPADYLIDDTGQVRYSTFGEGDYTTTESAIRALLVDAGAKGLGGGARAHDVVVPSEEATPETYLGTARAMGWVGGEPMSGTHTYPKPSYPLNLNDFAYGGSWTIGGQQALAGAGATIDTEIEAKHVYIVVSPPAHGHGTIAVSVDGHPTQTIDVTQQRLYQVAAFPTDSRHAIHLRFSPGTSGYSFTFG
ncbi:MAG: cytochrome c biogenesis protein DipZ, partial [Solirubrobacteraceae bacterium]